MSLQTEVEHFLQTAREDIGQAEARLISAVHNATSAFEVVRLHWPLFLGTFVSGALFCTLVFHI